MAAPKICCDRKESRVYTADLDSIHLKHLQYLNLLLFMVSFHCMDFFMRLLFFSHLRLSAWVGSMTDLAAIAALVSIYISPLREISLYVIFDLLF